MKKIQHVFIIGSKGIPAQYGGFETFVEQLTKYNMGGVQYHVACISDKNGSYIYHDAECVQIKVPNIGPAKAVYYDCAAMQYFIRYCNVHKEVEQPIFYILACRIGPFIKGFKKQIQSLKGLLYVNPDGHEWKRKKWSWPIRRYWKISEKKMIQHSDYVICDSKEIEKYIQKEYSIYQPKTKFIPYGAEDMLLSDQKKLDDWLDKWKLARNEYYILVGRFVQENNFEIIIREFMSSNTRRKLVIITGNNSKLKKKICKATLCQQDPRIVFAGTVYDPELLCAIRKQAYASFHGHEVGGTNPSLLEGMCCTKVNLVLDVAFNREVATDGALYWSKEMGNLSTLIMQVDKMHEEEIFSIHKKAVTRITSCYNWRLIEQSYRNLFLKEN